jgi:F0F1-type ATP synthase membrane subunit b/b'
MRNRAANPLDFVSTMACIFMGATETFTAEKLLQLYPTHDDYVQKYTAAAERALVAGYILEEDYEDAIEEAKNAPIPN